MSPEMLLHGMLDVPAGRRAPLRAAIDALRGAERVVLTTHVNADGDGAGSQAAICAWLAAHDVATVIVNPTPFPESFAFLLPPGVATPGVASAEAASALAAADVLLVLDTAEPRRIGRVATAVRPPVTVVLDHHMASDQGFDGIVLQAPEACAAGELVFDLLVLDGWPAPWPVAAREGVYTAIVTDTGSFRFSNATPRAHAIAGALIAQGVDPEAMYRRIFGTVPLRRIGLLRHALEQLEADPDWPVTWISLRGDVIAELGADSDDIEGVIEHARTIEGTEVAILFREVPDGSTKISLRSNGAVDVNAIARGLGGGGHMKASGVVLGAPLPEARARVLDMVRTVLAESHSGFRGAGTPA